MGGKFAKASGLAREVEALYAGVSAKVGAAREQKLVRVSGQLWIHRMAQGLGSEVGAGVEAAVGAELVRVWEKL